MLDIIEMSDLQTYQQNMPEGREKELLNKLLFEYSRYANCGTYEDCESRKEWFSYSLEHIMQNFNKTVKGLREYVEEIRQQADENIKKYGDGIVVGDTVWSIRCKLVQGGHKYDYAMTTHARDIERYAGMCYVAPKKCSKSDQTFLDKTIFKTEQEAEDFLNQLKNGGNRHD